MLKNKSNHGLIEDKNLPDECQQKETKSSNSTNKEMVFDYKRYMLLYRDGRKVEKDERS